MGKGLQRSAAAAKATQRSALELQIRNIVFNIEQNPDAHSVRDLLASMRSALGLRPGERP